MGQIQLPFTLLPTKPLAAEVTKNKWLKSTIDNPKATVQFGSAPLFTKWIVWFAFLCSAVFVLFCGLSSSGCSKALQMSEALALLSPSSVSGAARQPQTRAQCRMRAGKNTTRCECPSLRPLIDALLKCSVGF